MMLSKHTQLIAFAIFVGLLSGCDMAGLNAQSDGQTLMKTQARVSTEIAASAYQVEVVFKAEAENQALAMDELAHMLAPFEAWIESQTLAMVGGTAQLSGMYQYNPNEKRKLVAYEAMQQFTLSELDFVQYQAVMAQAPEFKPHRLGLLGVVASESEKTLAKDTLIHKGFNQAKRKALAMAEAAGLCDLSVSEMTENIHDRASPRMMNMAMAEEAVHGSESKQTMTLNLNVDWHAKACD